MSINVLVRTRTHHPPHHRLYGCSDQGAQVLCGVIVVTVAVAVFVIAVGLVDSSTRSTLFWKRCVAVGCDLACCADADGGGAGVVGTDRRHSHVCLG